MKKLIITVISLLLAFSVLVGCELLPTPEEETQESGPRIYSYSGLSIQLPGDFEDVKYGFANKDYLVRLFCVPFSDITPLEGESFPTLEEFMREMPTLKADPESRAIKSRDGISYIDHESTSKNIAQVFSVENDGDMQCLMGLESATAFYIISFYSPTLDYVAVKDQAFEWAKGITFGA